MKNSKFSSLKDYKPYKVYVYAIMIQLSDKQCGRKSKTLKQALTEAKKLLKIKK